MHFHWFYLYLNIYIYILNNCNTTRSMKVICLIFPMIPTQSHVVTHVDLIWFDICILCQEQNIVGSSDTAVFCTKYQYQTIGQLERMLLTAAIFRYIYIYTHHKNKRIIRILMEQVSGCIWFVSVIREVFYIINVNQKQLQHGYRKFFCTNSLPRVLYINLSILYLGWHKSNKLNHS